MRHGSLITLREPHSLVSESYRMFRTNLNYVNIDNNNKVIMFTSSSAEEGKTTSVCNAAVTLASSEKKVLLIECDLRKGRVSNLFGFKQAPGLINCLSEKLPFDEAVNQVEGHPNLYVLTAGVLPPNPAEILSSVTFENFIKEIKDKYDYILIDAPPVLAVADATVISRVADGVVLIIAANETKKQDVKQARSTLEKVGARILGVLLTKSDTYNKQKYYAY